MIVFAVADDKGAGRGGVVEGFAVEGEVVVGDGVLLRWNGGRGFGLGIAGVRLIGMPGLVLGAKGGQGAGEEECGEGRDAKKSGGAQKGAGRKDAGSAWQLAQDDLRRTAE